MADVLKLVNTEEQVRYKEDAETLRKVADDIEEGNVTEFLVCGVDRDGNVVTWSRFDSRIKTIGALEYAKTQLGL